MKRFLSLLLVALMLVPVMAFQVNAHEHSFTDWLITKEATCTTAGEQKRYCAGCQTLEVEEIAPLGHLWGEWKTVTKATPEQYGLQERKCTRCKITEESELPFDETELIEEKSEPVVIAYYNGTEAVVNEFKNIDILNYHPVQVIGSAGSSGSPFKSTIFNAIPSCRKRASKQNPNIKINLAVSNGSLDVFESWLKTAAYRQQFAEHFAELVRKYDIDGIELDYEFPQNTNLRAGFVDFIKRMRSEFDKVEIEKSRELTISIAVPAGQWAFSLFDICGLEPYLDWFSIMNYDLYIGSNYNKTTHHHTPAYDNKILPGGSVCSDIALYKSYNIPDEKIVAGIAMYAHRWTNVQDSTDGLFVSGRMDNTNIHYSDLLASYVNKNGYVRYWDDTSKAPYLYNKEKKEFITYDDEESVAAKCDLVLKNGVGGVMIFDYCTCDGTGIFDKIAECLNKTGEKHIWGDWVTVKAADCVNKGQKKHTCSCGEVEYADIPALGHNYVATTVVATCLTDGYTLHQCSRCTSNYTDTPVNALGHLFTNWYTVMPATDTQDGLETRVCTRDGCGAYEENVLPATGPKKEVYVTNYTLTIRDTDRKINAIRIAPGEWTTSSEIKNAVGVINLSATVIEANRDENGDIHYELPDGGVYSVWLRYSDSTQKIETVDASDFTQTVTTDGLKITVNNLYGVKDFFIAEGHYTTYREIKNTAGYVNVTSAKFGTAHSYTHGAAIGTVGEYTCLIRYTDTSKEDEFIYFNCEVTHPEITTDGRQISIGNLDGVKVIRIAQGAYDTIGAIKSASGALGYSAATIAKLSDGKGNFVLNKNATEEGTTYTVAVVYDNYYQEIHQLTLKKKVPAYTVSGNSVTFTNLDGFSMIRYAPGKYTTGSAIKAASGVKTVKSTDVSGTTVKLSNLTGKYSFLVQYYENSQSFIVIDF